MKEHIVIVSGSESIRQSLANVMSILFPLFSFDLVDDITTDILSKCETLFIDLLSPFKILGKPYTQQPETLLKTVQRIVQIENSNIICEYFGKPMLPNLQRYSLTFHFSKFTKNLYDKHLKKERLMNNNETGPAWHKLKYKKDEHSLKMLKTMGYREDAEKYEELYETDPRKAMEYAAQKWDRTQGIIPSHVRTHEPLYAASVDFMENCKIIGVLLVDDQRHWFKHFEKHVVGYNVGTDDFKFGDLRYASTPKEALKAIRCTGVHAVVLDYMLDRTILNEPSSVQLAKDIKRLRPDLCIFGLTGATPQKRTEYNWIVPDISWAIERLFYKNDPTEINELLLAIIEAVREKTSTPFFSSLRSYSKEPKVVFHALPLSRAKSVAGSQWTKDFVEFYGEGYFAGETSSTMPPLDTLFDPGYSLRSAMNRAAKAFSADKTLFVTNGTTGGNSIVYGIHLKPGDLIILDRNCHRSHHYAAIQCGAQVSYMEPEHIDVYGVSSIVSMSTILETVQEHRESVKMLVLTHPTFDGICYDPYEIIKNVIKIKNDIVFHFDEAWFAYGNFHCDFRARTAMAASLKLRYEGIEARVYATQSIHKTLSAMRQGSMIHIREPKFTPELKSAIEESINSHTTTSPNVHIMASLDVARMQAEIEGYDLLNKALSIADWIRNTFNDDSMPIRALKLEDLTTKSLRNENNAFLDPLKITLKVDGLPAAKFKKDELYAEMGIQTNKYSNNTVLILVTIGTTWSMADHLVRSLLSWKPALRKNIISSEIENIPLFSGFSPKFKGTKESIGKICDAWAMSRLPEKTSIIKLEECENMTSAVFVTPYPPGYPVIVPGQIVNSDIIKYINSLRNAGVGINDIHGLDKEECLRVFK